MSYLRAPYRPNIVPTTCSSSTPSILTETTSTPNVPLRAARHWLPRVPSSAGCMFSLHVNIWYLKMGAHHRTLIMFTLMEYAHPKVLLQALVGMSLWYVSNSYHGDGRVAQFRVRLHTLKHGSFTIHTKITFNITRSTLKILIALLLVKSWLDFGAS